MGSSGSKEASSGARRMRYMGVRVLRPACFRRPQVSLDDGCREETSGIKDIGCVDKARNSHQVDRNDSKCFSFTRSNPVPSPLPDNGVQQEDVQGHSTISQAFDSSSENMDEQHAKNVNHVVSTENAVASNLYIDGDECNETNRVVAATMERKLSLRRQEPLEDTARFSRTRSVGRLRERVLRRTSFPDGRFGFLLSEESSAYSRQDSRQRLLDALANIPYSEGGDNDAQLVSSTCQISDNVNAENSQNRVTETSELSEITGLGTADNSAIFLERRRRIRSQVRALQRLGNRFENISGHDRQCISSGQHRSGNCACGANSHSRNPTSQTSTRASISRIVMLAEALFEVLDEIHQQAVVLASRPSSASLASVPAPKEVVDRMPVKNYAKSQSRGNEATQCYICLVEYDEGDAVRMLPCLHEFHQSCVDKWLKEIHRVCPLCRYDVCLSDSSHVNVAD